MSNPTRRDLLKSGALAGLAGVVGCKAPSAAQPGPTPQKAQAHWEAPPSQKGNDLNLIVLVSDSFRADNLAAYGSTWVDTPNLNDFAKESIVFDSYYSEGLPTIPLRRQLYTGRRIFPTHLYFQQDSVKLPGWHELFIEDVTLAETLLAAGYQTALIADLPHLFKPGRNFQRGFHYFEWVRGQEIDYYGQAPRTTADFRALYPEDYLQLVGATPGGRGESFADFLNQYLANRKRWLKRAPSIAEATATSTIDWLKENHDPAPLLFAGRDL